MYLVATKRKSANQAPTKADCLDFVHTSDLAIKGNAIYVDN